MQVVQSPRIHPLIAAAATSIILVCMLGVALIAYMLPLGNNRLAHMATFFNRPALPAPRVASLPADARMSDASASFGPDVVLTTPAQLAAAASLQAMTQAPLTLPSSTTSAAADAPVPVAAPPAGGSAVTAFVPSGLRLQGADTALPKPKGLHAAQLAAARRATHALAHGGLAKAAADDSPPAKLSLDQLEAASRATAVLAQAAQKPSASPAGRTDTGEPLRMSAEHIQAVRELTAAKARIGATQKEPDSPN